VAEAYLQGLAGSGNFPNLAALGAAGLLRNDHDELTFETGSAGSSPASPPTPKQSPAHQPPQAEVPGAS
jgi:hypothetical protein